MPVVKITVRYSTFYLRKTIYTWMILFGKFSLSPRSICHSEEGPRRETLCSRFCELRPHKLNLLGIKLERYKHSTLTLASLYISSCLVDVALFLYIHSQKNGVESHLRFDTLLFFPTQKRGVLLFFVTVKHFFIFGFSANDSATC